MVNLMKTLLKFFSIFIVMFITFNQNIYAKLQEGFVYLQDIDSSIKQNIIYATSNNFMGEPAPGYNKAVAILTKKAALALKKAPIKTGLGNYCHKTQVV